MLDEMGESALVVGFRKTADVETHPNDHAVLGRAILEQRIFHSVGQNAEDDVGVDRQVARGKVPGPRGTGLGIDRSRGSSGISGEDGYRGARGRDQKDRGQRGRGAAQKERRHAKASGDVGTWGQAGPRPLPTDDFPGRSVPTLKAGPPAASASLFLAVRLEVEHGIVATLGQQTEPARNLLIGFDFAAKVTAEAILVELFVR